MRGARDSSGVTPEWNDENHRLESPARDLRHETVARRECGRRAASVKSGGLRIRAGAAALAGSSTRRGQALTASELPYVSGPCTGRNALMGRISAAESKDPRRLTPRVSGFSSGAAGLSRDPRAERSA